MNGGIKGKYFLSPIIVAGREDTYEAYPITHLYDIKSPEARSSDYINAVVRKPNGFEYQTCLANHLNDPQATLREIKTSKKGKLIFFKNKQKNQVTLGR